MIINYQTQPEKDILDAATTLFANQGYHNTTIREVTEFAKLSNSMLNYYFRTKENLLQTILKIIYEKQNNEKIRGKAIERLSKYIDSIIEHILSEEDYVKIIFQENLQNINPEIKKIINQIFTLHKNQFLSIINHGISIGEFQSNINADILYYYAVGTLKYFFEFNSLAGNNPSELFFSELKNIKKSVITHLEKDLLSESD